jgi:hypothetical protein
MAKRVYIAHEAAAVSGAPVALYQKEISGRRMPHEALLLDRTSALAFALVTALPKVLHISPEFAYRLFRNCRRWRRRA